MRLSMWSLTVSHDLGTEQQQQSFYCYVCESVHISHDVFFLLVFFVLFCFAQYGLHKTELR